MNQLSLCHVLCELAAKADELEKIEDLLGMLQHTFVTVFGMTKRTEEDDEDDHATRRVVEEKEKKTAASLESTEEAKMAVVEAVRLFHDTAVRRHAAFLHDASYQPHAALFIHELLKSLSGNSQKWYRQLQLESLKACMSILRVIGVPNVRLCVPGVVSAAVRYIHRAHLGKNTSAVRRSTISMLQQCLAIALQGTAQARESQWLAECVAHLGTTMRKVLDPAFLCEGYVDHETATDLMALVTFLLTAEAVREDGAAPLHQELLIAYAVLDSLILLQTLDTPVPPLRGGLGQLPSGCVVEAVSHVMFRDAVLELQKVSLLHVATFLLRCAALRHVLINAEDGVEVVLGIVRKCVRLVAREVAPEDLYAHRAPRRFPSGVVDQFLECLAHALAGLSSQEASAAEDDMSAGEAITNALMDQWETVLNDWDLYHLHPAAIYVLSRLVTWQFKPLPVWWGAAADGSVVYPSPGDFLSSGAFEQLWGVVAAPHLWHITADEDLCNNQQIHHRQVIAATVLRFLSIAAQDVLAPCVARGDQHSFDRYCTLVLYLVMEKAATTSIVHAAATDCLRSICEASGVPDVLHFYLGVGHVIVDEASRAIEVESLRPAAASVLRGAVQLPGDPLRASGRRRECGGAGHGAPALRVPPRSSCPSCGSACPWRRCGG
ncbi:hypothetical protein STCU_09197 [Strigomonas culicis]|uniref:Uncharacterized protein n=1 Tax=Strigomonas culicis TaxID=28005 RepID=S9VAG7_9TRYP|nr:hypothetical protein STCU_09197 [Strigomonas culicis]|eukprot:EPY20015.1 hypothetical protein STCU_09197 [Strigomonas culicis]